jgi:predicted transcriptional regulator
LKPATRETEQHEHLQSMSIRLEPSLRRQLEALARAEDRPLSWLVRKALRAEAARREQTTEHAA